ncbi:MAG: peroxidase [Algicola sp.]|nr:peroxidase [Algicola sp.]
MPNSSGCALNLADIQGFILRGYHTPFVRHYILRIENGAAAKQLLGGLATADDEFMHITDARPWLNGKPDYCLNVGLTHTGLSRLMNTNDIEFPGRNIADQRDAFKEGAVAAAPWVGDTGQSAPEYWWDELGTDKIHVVFSLYSTDLAVRAKKSEILQQAFSENNAFSVTKIHDGASFPGDLIHFDYKDGIAQPQIEDAPGLPHPDCQPQVQSWQFILQQVDMSGHFPENPHCTYQLNTETQKALLLNGSFAAFRVMQQDVVGFEQYLDQHKDIIDPELLAAKLCGRWRDGSPLVLDPDHKINVAPNDINNFDYYKADPHGDRCPVGSHIRRSNPRNQPIRGSAGGDGRGTRNHRIIRRGMPYGPQYVPGSGDDGIERGLMVMFICADLANQYEFILKDWVQQGDFASGGPAGKDPLIGTVDGHEGGVFETTDKNGEPTVLKDLPQFVRTRGCAYLFLPSLKGLKHIAEADLPG